MQSQDIYSSSISWHAAAAADILLLTAQYEMNAIMQNKNKRAAKIIKIG